MEQTDEELLDAYTKGQTNALEALMNRYQPKIFNFCLRFLGQRADAEDVTQEVMLTLMSNKYRVNPNAKFSTWLFTVARNNCISQIRKRKKFLFFHLPDADGENKSIEVEDRTHISREDLQEKEVNHLIKSAVLELPLNQKEVIILREYEGLSYSQISEVTGNSLENVKILIFRARETLREKLSMLLKEGSL